MYRYLYFNSVYTIVVAVFILCTVLLLPRDVDARVSYTISPLVIDLSLEARDIVQREVIVTNTGDQPISIFPTVNNISLDAGGTIEAFLPPSASDRTSSLASWLEFSRLGRDIKPGESYTLPLTFRINPSPVPGTYHAFLGFPNGENRDIAERIVAAGQAPGIVVSVTIDKKTTEFMKLSKFVVSRIVTGSSNQAAVYTFSNPGDEPVSPKGEIILYSSTGEEVRALPVNAEGIVIPPGGTHSFSTDIPFEGMLGKYKAYLSVEYGTQQRAVVNDTSFFYIFPLKKLAILLGVLILFVGVAAWFMHKRYIDGDSDDSDRLIVHVRDSVSDAKDHDLDLKKKT